MAAKAKEADVEEDDKPEEEGEQPASKSKFKFIPTFKLPPLKWMIIGGAGLLVLIGGGGGAYYFLKGPAHKEPQVTAKPATSSICPTFWSTFPLLAATGRNISRSRSFLSFRFDLVPQIQPLMPRVMDAFQTYLRELRPTDLDGSAGLYRLKEELTRRVNAAVAPTTLRPCCSRKSLSSDIAKQIKSRRLTQWRQKTRSTRTHSPRNGGWHWNRITVPLRQAGMRLPRRPPMMPPPNGPRWLTIRAGFNPPRAAPSAS